MDINNNQQINTFTKGMNTDTSDAFIGADQYRYAENLRISTDTNSSGGSLVPIDGTVKIDNNICDWDNIIAVTSARDILIVVGIKKVSGVNYMQIYEYNTTDQPLLGLSPRSWRPMITESRKVQHKNAQGEVVSTETITSQDFNGILLGDDSAVPSEITTVARWESDKNVKLYIADGTHTLMWIRLDKQTDVDTLYSATPTSDVLLAPAVASETDAPGNVRAAKVQYAYVLYAQGAAASGLSPLSNQLVLYKDLTHGYGIDGDEGPDTGQAVQVQIPAAIIEQAQSQNSNISNIKIYRIAYLLSGQEPKVDLIYDDVISGYTYVDNGTSRSSISIEELLAYDAPQVIPHEIESKGEFLFLGNISYVKDGVDYKFKHIDTTAPSSGKNAPFKTYEWNHDQWLIPGSTELGGCGEYFKWEYDVKTITVDFDNKTDDDTLSLRRGEIYRYGVILYDEHGQASSPKFVADIMVPPESEPGFEVVNEITSTGVIFNKIGIKFSLVKDITEEGVYGWEIVRCHRSYSDRINLFQGICGLPLRVYKDTRSDNPSKNPSDTWSSSHFAARVAQNRLYPGGFMSMQYYRDAWNAIGNMAYTEPSVLMFACPEFCYMETDTQNVLVNKDNSLIFEPTACYSIHTYDGSSDNYTYIQKDRDNIDSKSISSFRRIEPTELFGSGVTVDYPYQQWLDAYGPEGIDAQNIDISTYTDCKQLTNTISYEQQVKQYIASYHILPKEKCDIQSYVKQHVSIDGSHISYAKVSDEQWNSLTDNNLLRFMNDSTNTGENSSLQFINWVASGLDYQNSSEAQGWIIDALKGGTEYITSSTKGLVRYAATGGKHILFPTSEKGGFGYFNSTDGIFPIQIGNIKNTHAIPYGGYSEASRINSVYYGYGNFTTGSEIEVFDGDTYLCMFTYNAAHYFADGKYVEEGDEETVHNLWNIPRLSVVYTVPIESSVNLKARSGFLLDDESDVNLSCFIQDHPVSIPSYVNGTGYTQGQYAYVYNAAYDSLPDVIKYIPIYYNNIQSNTYDNRICYSGPKKDGEQEDSWFTIAGDVVDVDSRYGAVTGMRLFKDKLIFWQERATGLLTVNEKTIINDVENGDIILANTPGVVNRYDYISTKYGMKKGQHTDVQSDNALYWWDSDNKELLQYSNALVPLTKAHFIENYINDTQESVKPCLSYYCDFDEIIANVRRSGGNNGESVVFNEKLNVFTSIYTFDPIYSASIGNDLYLAKARGNNGSKAEIHVMTLDKNKSNTELFGNPAYPLIQYIVNNQSSFVKTFDIQTMGGSFYGNGGHGERSTNQEDNPDLRIYPRVTLTGNDTAALKPLTLSYTTPLKQHASMSGDGMTNREYDFRLDIPRNGNSSDWGDRLRGKTMQCTIRSDSNSKNFSLQYVITKYRMSWS